MPLQNDYTTQALIDRVTLKGRTSASTSLTPQQIIDLANDSLRSYLVPLTQSLREEWWIGKSDIVLTTGSDGSVTVPDSVASTLRTVAWNNGGIVTPLTRIEPEAAFGYQSTQGLPVGFTLRGYTLFVLPPTAGVAVHLTAMLRPPQMVLTEQAGLIDSVGAFVVVLDAVPTEWQETTPTTVDFISNVSPFSVVRSDVAVVSLVGTALTLATSTSGVSAGFWVADVGASPFANVPIELYPLLEADVVCVLCQSTGDKRLKDMLARKDELEQLAKRTLGPRTSGNARPIVNPSAPGMRGFGGRRW